MGDRHLVTIPQGVVGDRLPWGGERQGGGGGTSVATAAEAFCCTASLALVLLFISLDIPVSAHSSCHHFQMTFKRSVHNHQIFRNICRASASPGSTLGASFHDVMHRMQYCRSLMDGLQAIAFLCVLTLSLMIAVINVYCQSPPP